MPEQPSLDPLRTVDFRPTPAAASPGDTVGDATRVESTGPHLAAPPADAPRIPGYHLTAEIARGGMGRVYAGLDLTLGRELAIKTLLPGASAARFVGEAKIAARLPHPGIPPVHALGTLDDGTPYLAMKLVRGRTLAALLQEQPSPPPDLPRFVQIFEQIAQAVGFAHAQGIIHRDLKPANVMVGAFGEVQVMDWGLAKTLRQGDKETGRQGEETFDAVSLSPCLLVSESEVSPSPENRTRMGTVLGTPGYMAPEQARGEPADARADVFALGAILAAVLTGKPAFVGSTARETIDRAARADLADVHSRVRGSGADGELIALALRCLSADVTDRPADGRAVAVDVATYRAGVEARLKQAETERAEALVREAEQRKRRRTVLVAAVAVALVLMAGLGVSLWQMNRAIDAEGQARGNAESARQERDAKDVALKAERKARADEAQAYRRAFAALRSMTAEVVERKFQQGVVLTDEDRAFLCGVIAQYDAFAAILGNDVDSRAVRAEGRARVAFMRFRLGELAEAEAGYDAALVIQQQLAADFPNRPDIRRELAASYTNRGLLLRATGRLKEAEQDHNAALGIRKQLAADFPTLPDFRQELAKSHTNRGNLLRATDRPKEAEQDYDQALGIQKQLAVDFPKRLDFRQELAGSHTSRGVLLYATGRLKEAEQDYNAAFVTYKQLATDFPNRLDFQRELAGSRTNREFLLSATGRLKEAAQDYNAALGTYKQLAADFPNRPDFRQELAGSHTNRGLLLRASNRPKEAEQDYDQALAIRKQLAADFPSRPDFRQELAISYFNRGLLLRATGQLTEAEQDYDAALVIQKQLVAEFPTRSDFRQELATTYTNRGLLLSATGRLKEAERDHDQALGIRTQLVADFPNQPDRRNELAGTCVNLAILHQQQGDGAAARRRLLEGRPHHLAALQANPRHPAYRQFYRNHLTLLARVHARLLEKDDAVRAAHARRDVGWDPPADAYDAATILSRCVSIVATHDKLDDTQRKMAQQFYGDKAMTLLRVAVSKGFKDAAKLKRDADFAPLRGREDFKTLLAELEAKGK